MLAYIKRRSDFRTAAAANAVSYVIPLESGPGEKGTVVLAASGLRGSTGDFLLMDGHIWLIDTINMERGEATVAVVPVLNLFDRKLIYTAPASGTTIGAWVKSQIESAYKNQSDAVYALPYLSVENQDSTSFVAPDTDDNGLYVLSDYLDLLHRVYNIRLSFAVSGGVLAVTISRETRKTAQVVFNDGHAQLASETYSRKSAAKITTIQAGTVRQWYLAADGSISNSVPANRAEGSWEVLALKDRDNAAEKVAARFAKNKHSHKVEFYSDRAYELYEDILIRMEDGTVLSSHISYTGASSADRRYYCRSGELAVRLTDILKEAGK